MPGCSTCRARPTSRPLDGTAPTSSLRWTGCVESRPWRGLLRRQLRQHPPPAPRQRRDHTPQGADLLLGQPGSGEDHPKIAAHRRLLGGWIKEAGLVEFVFQMLIEAEQLRLVGRM